MHYKIPEFLYNTCKSQMQMDVVNTFTYCVFHTLSYMYMGNDIFNSTFSVITATLISLLIHKSLNVDHLPTVCFGTFYCSLN
jgi:hypothetical protein